MDKTEILKLLLAFDKVLDEPLEITICGGASGHFFFGIQRGTMDVDVLISTIKLSNYERSLMRVAEEHGLEGSAWLNDSAKGFLDYLPPGYLKRRIPLKGNFQKLKVYSISKVDYFILKLVAFRPQDLDDISRIKLDRKEIAFIEKSVKKIANMDEARALKMKLFIEEYRLNE